MKAAASLAFFVSRSFLHLCFHHAIFDFLKEKFGLAELMACRKKVYRSETVPLHFFHMEHAAEFLAGEGEERFESYGEVGHKLEGEVEDGLHTFRVGLDDLPRLGIGEIFVADAC